MTDKNSESRHRSRTTLVIAAATLLAGCAALPTAEDLDEAPSPHRSPEAPAGVSDQRSRFRNYFCAELEARQAAGEEGETCDRWLHRLPDETDNPPAATALRVPLQVLFVTGAFSECFGESARPFAEAIDNLAASGDRFDTIVVGGRSGTEHNARQIAEFLESWPADEEKPLVLVGYSKGTSDILQFLVDYPALARRVSALVSVAGAVGGSPLADDYDGLYNLLLSHLPSSHCEVGDHDVVHSLRTDVRKAWLAENSLPDYIHYYSLAAFTTREHVARALVPSWEALLNERQRNDGQLLPTDALLPQSTLLAYLNADHWSVAMRLEEEHEFLASRDDPTPFPQTALLGAILRTVGEDLANGGAISGDDRPRRSAPGHRR